MKSSSSDCDLTTCKNETESEETVDKRVLLCITALREMSELTRTVFCLIRYDNKSYPDVAKELGISVQSVETHLMRALDKFKEVDRRMVNEGD